MSDSAEISTAPRMIYFALPDDPELLAKVGAIALRHAHLDRALTMTIKTLAGLSAEQAVDATSRTGSGELRARIRKLARSRLGEGKALLMVEAILERCRRATKRRNEIMHNIWARELDGESVTHTDTHEWRPLPTIDELLDLEITLDSLVYELNHSRLEGFLLEALRGKGIGQT
jgi:hypothetical protein